VAQRPPTNGMPLKTQGLKRIYVPDPKWVYDVRIMDYTFWVPLAATGLNLYLTHRQVRFMEAQIGTTPLPKLALPARLGRYWPIATMFVLMLACWIPYFLSRTTENTPTAYMTYYGALVPGATYQSNPFLRVDTEGRFFKSYGDDYYIAAVAFRLRSGDWLDAKNLQKSGPHDIRDGVISMAIPLDIDFLESIGRQVNTDTGY
jgi:hypothetical protein